MSEDEHCVGGEEEERCVGWQGGMPLRREQARTSAALGGIGKEVACSDGTISNQQNTQRHPLL